MDRYIEHKMCDSILEQTQAFRGGMLDVLQEPGLLALFTPAELGELLGGAKFGLEFREIRRVFCDNLAYFDGYFAMIWHI